VEPIPERISEPWPLPCRGNPDERNVEVKKVLVGLAVLVVSAVAVAPAAADTPGCVTKTEYRSVKKGATLAKVKRVFDTAVRRVAIATSDGYGSQIRNYRACGRFSAVSLSFSKVPGGVWRMDAKSAVWVG
jgi:hypothetical protein